MRSSPLWFGDPERPLFGWLDLPDDGRAKAGVVVCPPLAVEEAATKPTLARLSGRLVDEGYAVLRFDYDGTGDSAGLDQDPGRLEGWLGSVRAALDAIDALGLPRTAVVGLRMGALLAAAALHGREGVDAFVLWDPCLSGRSFMRQQSVLRRMVDRGEILDDGSVECLGIVLTPETVAELSDLELGGQAALPERLLVLTRPGRPVPDRVRLALDRPGAHWLEVGGQEDLVDVEPVRVVVPVSTLELIVAWMVESVDGESVPVVPPDASSAVVVRTPDGVAIREQVVWLGPDRLFGIETVPDGPRPPDAPTVLFLNAGVIDHVGPGRVWVVLARELAAHGLRSVRFDLSGVGETPARIPSGERATRSIEGIQDVARAQAAASPDDPSGVVLIGLCSGGYHASEAALSTGVRGVVMINPIFRLMAGDSTPEPDSGAGTERQVDEKPKGWVARVPARALLWQALRRAPDVVWRVVNRVAVDHPPAETLTRVAETGADVLVACDEYDVWVLQRGGRRALRPFSRDGRLQVEVVAGMDHTLFCRQPRELTSALVVRHLVERFAPATGSAAGPAGPAPVGSYPPAGDLVGR